MTLVAFDSHRVEAMCEGYVALVYAMGITDAGMLSDLLCARGFRARRRDA